MIIYVASSWRNVYQPGVVKFLRALGNEVYDFRHPDSDDAGFAWSDIDSDWENWTSEQYRKNLNHTIAKKGCEKDRDAMCRSDVCVLVLPCGRSAHLEAGWMIGTGRRLHIYIPTEVHIEPELMYLLADTICTNQNELTMQIVDEMKQ